MKKLLLIAATLVLAASCQRLQVGGQYLEPVPDEVINLSTGSGASVVMSKTSTDAGFREEFKVGDQIALFAAYLTATEPVWTTSDAEQDSLNQVGPYFLNIPACCTEVASDGKGALFAWGPAGEANLTWNRIYPKNSADIHIYGYYPYNAAADTVTVDDTNGPEYLIALLSDGTTTGQGGDSTYADLGTSANKQADILWVQALSAAGQPAINRLDPVAPLVFKHALAQMDFKIKRDEKATACYFHSINFTVPRLGKMSITTGEIDIQKDGAEYASSELITYNIKQNTLTPLPTTAASVFSGNSEDYLMIFPLTAEQTKDLVLNVTVSYGTGTDELKTYSIPMTTGGGDAVLSAIEAGKLNTITLNVLETGISIEASIEEWDTENGSDNDVNVE